MIKMEKYSWDVACPGVGVTDSVTDGLKYVINDEFWHLHLCPEDWTKFEEKKLKRISCIKY